MLENILKIASGLVDASSNTVSTVALAVDTATKIKTAINSSKVTGDAETMALITDLITEVQDAKFSNLELKQQVIDLSKAAMEAQSMQNQFDRYELQETPVGAIVLALKETDTMGEAHHYICPTCKENGKKSILQGHKDWRKCNTCHSEYKFGSDFFGSIKSERTIF